MKKIFSRGRTERMLLRGRRFLEKNNIERVNQMRYEIALIFKKKHLSVDPPLVCRNLSTDEYSRRFHAKFAYTFLGMQFIEKLTVSATSQETPIFLLPKELLLDGPLSQIHPEPSIATSNMYFHLNLLKIFVRNVLYLFVLLKKSKWNYKLRCDLPRIFVHGSPAGSLSLPSTDRMDFASWIREKYGDQNLIIHDQRDVADGGDLLNSLLLYDVRDDFFSKIRFILRGFRLVSYTLVKYLKGQFDGILLLDELLEVELLDRALIRKADRHLFLNTLWPNKRLIYSIFEQHCRDCALVFYSTNNFPIIREGQLVDNRTGWSLMHWSHYFVWDNYQRNLVRRLVGDAPTITVVGPVPLVSGRSIPDGFISRLDLFKGSVAVFDITPHRPSVYAKHGYCHPYYKEDVVIEFLEILSDVCGSNGVCMVLKPKRFTLSTGKRYQLALNNLSALDHVILLPDDSDLSSVIKNCRCCVSFPFSSPALMAKFLGKPAAYFDVLGQLSNDMRFTHGVSYFTGRNQLERFIKDSGIGDVF